MSLRVCMIIYHYWPGPEGGAERQCRKLSKALAYDGIACTVLTTRAVNGALPIEDDDGVRIFRLPTVDGFRKTSSGSGDRPRSLPLLSPGHFASVAGALTMWLNIVLFQACTVGFLLRHAGKFDLFHVHTTEWIGGFAVWCGRRWRKPVLCKPATLPGLPPVKRIVPLRKLWDKYRRLADCYAAPNEAIAANLAVEGISAGRIHIVPNSTELPDLSTRQEEPNLVLFVGNLTQCAEKAFDILFPAWVQVHQRQPDAKLVVLGGGDPSEWMGYLYGQDCGDSVVFEGFIRDVDAFYRRASIFILPSRQEGMSNALLEAQSWGLPSVVSDIPGNLSVVESGHNGVVVPVNNVGALADGINHLLTEPDIRQAMGMAARQRIEEQFTLNVVKQQITSLYAQMVSVGSPTMKEADIGKGDNVIKQEATRD